MPTPPRRRPHMSRVPEHEKPGLVPFGKATRFHRKKVHIGPFLQRVDAIGELGNERGDGLPQRIETGVPDFPNRALGNDVAELPLVFSSEDNDDGSVGTGSHTSVNVGSSWDWHMTMVLNAMSGNIILNFTNKPLSLQRTRGGAPCRWFLPTSIEETESCPRSWPATAMRTPCFRARAE